MLASSAMPGWHSARNAEKSSPPKAATAFDAASLEGARKATLPETLSPQLATLAKSAPTHGDWLYEIKFDGYRLMTRLAQGKATIITRGGHDWTHKMQPLADELATLGINSGWLDGEAVVLDAKGLPHFNLLQNALDSRRSSQAIVYYVFDVPFLDETGYPDHARGVRWNDPAFGIAWPPAERTILERDQSYADFIG